VLGEKNRAFCSASWHPHRWTGSIHHLPAAGEGAAEHRPRDARDPAWFLQAGTVKDVNNVNVRSAAAALGLTVEEKKSDEPVTFNEWLHVQVFNGTTKAISAGGNVLRFAEQSAHRHGFSASQSKLCPRA